MTPLESQRTWAGNIKGLLKSIRVYSAVGGLKAGPGRDLESAESSAPCSPALCPCVKAALGLGHSQARGTSLSASPASLKDIRMPEHFPVCRTSASAGGFPRLTLLIVQKVQCTTICQSHSISRNFRVMLIWARRGSPHPAQAAATTSRM